jgi:thioredoxin-related protein
MKKNREAKRAMAIMCDEIISAIIDIEFSQNEKLAGKNKYIEVSKEWWGLSTGPTILSENTCSYFDRMRKKIKNVKR